MKNLGFKELNKRKDQYLGFYKTNRQGSEHAFVGAVVAQGRHVVNACKHIKTSHMHYAKKTPQNHPKEPLYTKYGIYDPDANKVRNKHISYTDYYNKHTYPLPLGI
tara:strand:- start:373 stop:690 length:318 start_codon:yes stop_codon:yes gene_type:complete